MSLVASSAVFAMGPVADANGASSPSNTTRAATVPDVSDLAVLGDAVASGSTASVTGNQPIVGLARTPSGNGAWFVAGDGGIFAFGSAAFFGSTGGLAPASPVIAMAVRPTGDGYWLVEAGGDVHPFGAAPALGDVRSATVTMPIVAVVATPSGTGLSFAGTGSTVVYFLRGDKLAAARRDARDPDRGCCGA